MQKLSLNKGSELGKVFSVDTKKILVKVNSEECLNSLKINDIIVFNGNNNDEMLVGITTKVSKKISNSNEDAEEENQDEIEMVENFCSIALVGTFYDKLGTTQTNVFRRAINTYPEINSIAFKATDPSISIIMNAVGSSSKGDKNLKIGEFSINKNVPAILNGNKFFQRHACIVGSTGSGKSWTIASILEKINLLDYSNTILFDLHGEYNELTYAKHIKISAETGGLKMPLWFFNYEEIHSLFIESSEGTSANQRAVVIDYILTQKKEYLNSNLKELDENIITADTPLPFSVNNLTTYLNQKNIEEIDTGEFFKTGDRKGQPRTKQGPHNGKLTNLVNRLQSKIDDKKYAFVFDESATISHEYLNIFAKTILEFSHSNNIKVIDLSEVPSDILPIIIGTLTRLIYDIQFWMTPESTQVRHPLVFICDEAHKYMPNNSSKLKSVEKKSLDIFEKIAKEGRKYGVGLLVVSQRPSELNTTIFSQCNNIISLKISNDRDKSAVSNMLTDSLSGLIDILPNLDKGECIVVGDSIMVPSKIILDKPKEKPKSSTIEFWDKWEKNENTVFNIDQSITNMINQTRN